MKIILSGIFILGLVIIGCDVGNSKDEALPEKLYLFRVDPHNGNLGGRTGADKIVSDAIVAGGSHIPVGLTKSVAFISISATDQLKDIPSNYNFPTSVPIYGPDGIAKIADNWADLMDETIDITLTEAGVLPDYGKGVSWWSGSNSDGTVHTDTCQSWTNTASNGRVGDSYSKDTYWINDWTIGGDGTPFLLGIGF